MTKIRGFFPNISALSKTISDKIGVNPITLRRNRQYRSLLNKHLISQPTITSTISVHENNTQVLKAKISEMQITLSNLRNDNHRLRAYVEDLHTQLDQKTLNKPIELQSHRSNQDFLATVYLLDIVLERLGGFEIDSDNDVLLDTTSPTELRIVAGKDICNPYITWKKNPKLISSN